ncbi:hypothetical protein SAMN05720764_11478 [Fibrobacter sp. UWH5]|uniref:DUF5677 domain-containing protein n=1 Tax=Fibrobacter sp. UWH5 TaxID=1896211 RepID=UPI000923249E|nr:DUF5677 domain-containing protein [Fibrobacter sp. UWH5]SHL46318.1 hypothetical protein SAMN05720764_11478 [Fibrobacter sp. UWH5]
MAKKFSLNGHEFRNGVFVTPMNDALGELLNPCSWFTERLPEYIWIGLILNSYDSRKEGLQKVMELLYNLAFISDELPFPAWSRIFELDKPLQDQFFQVIENLHHISVLSPLNLLYSYSEKPVFSAYFSNESVDFKKNCDILESMIRKMGNHQSDFSTDVRFCVLYYQIVSGKFHVPPEQLRELSLYPIIEHSDEMMRSIRPLIRSIEMQFPLVNHPFIEDFWNKCGAMFECKSFTLQYEKDVEDSIVESYTVFVKNVFYYYGDLYRITNPLNDKMLVLLGLATYSYKRFLEIVEHNLFNTISGRSIIRVLIEDFVMMKFLLKQETQNSEIWKEYQSYGMGGLKLVTERYSALNKKPNEKSHFDLQYLNILVDFYKNRMMQNMDTRMFEGGNVKQKFESVDEKDLHLIYDYDSAFEHGLWGAIRESSLLSCDSPGHQYHCILDVENQQKMKSVWYDSVMVMNKTIKLLVDEFGISDDLKKRMAEHGM